MKKSKTDERIEALEAEVLRLKAEVMELRARPVFVPYYVYPLYPQPYLPYAPYQPTWIDVSPTITCATSPVSNMLSVPAVHS